MEAHKPEKTVASVLRGPKEGKAVWIDGTGVVFKLFGSDTGGSFSIVEHPLRPRTLVPPHLHADTDEFSIVVKGKVGARVGDQVVVGGPGSYILKPRGVPHTFWNPGQTMARVVEIISPPGFENFIDEGSKLFQTSQPPDFEKVKDLASKYHTTFGWDEWVPQLSAKYKLKLFGR